MVSEETGLWMGLQPRGGQKGFDHITIHPPDRLGLPPRGMCHLRHVSTDINKHVCDPPHSKPLEKGTGTSSRALPSELPPGLSALDPLMHSRHSTARPQ